jgi:hypothetical protein
MTVPYSFANATVSIPLSQLDANFNTPITLGNTAIQLGNTVTTLNNMTLANVTISSGNVTITNVSVTTANVTTANITNMSSGNVAITGGSINGTTLGATTASTANVTTLTTSSTVTINGGTANGVAYLNGSKVLTTGSALTFDGTNLGVGGTSGYETANRTTIAAAGVNSALLGFKVGGISAGYAFADASHVEFGAPTGRYISWDINGEQMRLNSTGLSIGTSSPQAKLHVAGSIFVTGDTGLGGITADGITTRFLSNVSYLQSVQVSSGTVLGGRDLSLDANKILFRTISGAAFSEKMQLDNSGNLGLGAQPSAWTLGILAFQSGQRGTSSYYYTQAPIMGHISNGYNDGSWKYYSSNPSARYEINNATHAWFTAGSGTAGNAITFTQAMTLDASGRLGLGGVTSPIVTLDIGGTSGTLIRAGTNSGNGSTNFWPIIVGDGSSSGGGTNQNFVRIGRFTDGTAGIDAFLGGVGNAPLAFGTFGTERARITSGGQLLVGTQTSSSSLSRFSWATNARTVEIENTNASLSTDAQLFVYTERNTTNNSYYYFGCYNGTAGAWKLRIADSGNVTNTNGSYGTISDRKMKTDIVDAGSQWADIKAVKFRKFKMRDDPAGVVQLGVVAQELEQTSPGLVEEHADRDAEGNDLGTTTKSVKTSVLLMKAAVALQEAMARIETLEAKIAALEAK